MNIINYISMIETRVFVLCAIGFAALLYICYAVIKKPAKKRYVFLTVVAAVLVVEIFVFNNPIFFEYSSNSLGQKDIGWRQDVALSHEIYRFKKINKTKILAVGSSQTGAIYRSYALESPDVSVFGLAGMNSVDFLLYKDMIKKRAGETVILTLSDFDIARKMGLLGQKTAPPQSPVDLIRTASLLYSQPKLSRARIQDYVLSNLISAYRYQYIFKGFVDKLSRRNEAFPEKDVTALNANDMRDRHMTSLEGLTVEWFDTHLTLLKRFISWAGENGLKVVIAEGHYHPDVLVNNMQLHDSAVRELSLLCDKYSNATFYGAEQLYEFSKEDYRDMYHVKKASGYKFSEVIVDLITKGPI